MNQVLTQLTFFWLYQKKKIFAFKFRNFIQNEIFPQRWKTRQKLPYRKNEKNPIYAQYTPDHIEPKRYSKAFLLNLIAYLEPELFKKLYVIQKQQLLNKSFNEWKNYKIEIKSNLLDDVNNFSSIDIKRGKQTGFRKIKNNSLQEFFFRKIIMLKMEMLEI